MHWETQSTHPWTFRESLHPHGKAQRRKIHENARVSQLWVLTVLTVLSATTLANGVAAANVFKDCGGELRDPRGVVQSPGFPGRFPVPLSCVWVIRAAPDKKIVLYFTQYFLRGAFHLTEYEYYQNEMSYAGKKSLGQINFEDYIHTVVAYRPFLVLEFRLHQMTNIHLRVEEYLEDVYGFNITYEIVDREERVRQDTCSVSSCSFLGHCVAAADFSRYWCACFPGFFGGQCQYGPFCDPDKGMNMCRNKGRCRYFYGSMVNVCDCPPGFLGPKCEHRVDNLPEDGNNTDSRSSGDESVECQTLGCRDGCERNRDGHLHCVCREGFTLAKDNVTCVDQQMYRVTVAVPLVKRPDDWDVHTTTLQAVDILKLAGLSTAQRFQYDGVNSTGDQDHLVLHFYVDGSDVKLARAGMETLVRVGIFGNATILADNYTLRLDPEMKLLSLENYDTDPALEGGSLTLICTARGSRQLTFRWFKDQFLFNASLTSRNAWVVRIQEELDNKQMSIFNVDGVSMFDKGTFCCEVEDFGEVQNRSLTVDVVPLPHVEIKPLTASVLAGQSLSLRCLSPDENMRTFSYQWLRNGQPITAQENGAGHGVNGEQVEDLWPTGSRLVIPLLRVSANYTCRVLNKAGASQKTAHVFLVDPGQSGRVCENTQFQGVKWNRTYGDHFDLQQCPMDSADFKVVGLGEGHARRDCVCDDAETCDWGPPNYAKCHSVHLTFLYEQLERCQLGYQKNDLGEVWDSLYQILYRARNRTLAGDVEMFAVNLYTLMDIIRRFPAVAPSPSGSSFSLKTVASFMNVLLDEVEHTNDYERRDLSVGSRFLQVCEILAELTLEHHTLLPLANLSLPAIGFVVRNVTVVSHNASVGSDVERKLMDGEGEASKEMSSHSEEEHLTILQVTFSPSIFPILPMPSNRPEYKEFLTPLVSVLPLGGSDGRGDPFDVTDGKVEVDFVHLTQILSSADNITKCVSWERTDRQELKGEWSGEVCEVTHRSANLTRCLCPVPGHYAVLLSAANASLPPVLHIHQDTVLLVGCMLCLCGLTATLFVLFICWRQTSGYGSVIHVSFIVSLSGINLICILCLSHTHRQTLCMAGKLCLHFLQLSTFTFLLMEATHTYVCIQAAGLGGQTRLKYTYAKYCLVGWGVPSLATLAVALLSEIFGDDKQCTTWCWWSSGQWQHLSLLVPLAVMTVVQIFILAVCLIVTRRWTDEHRFREHKKYRYIAGRSLLLQGLLVSLCLSGHLVETSPSLGRQWLFVLLDIALTMAVVIMLLAVKPHVRKLMYSLLWPAHKRALASESFRAFVLPDRVEDTELPEVKRIQQYCTDLDRSKFTTQHKQALRTLLGSSSSGSEASGSMGSSAEGSNSSCSSSTSGRGRSSTGSRSSWSDSGAVGTMSSGTGGARRTPVRKSRGRRRDLRGGTYGGGGGGTCGRCGEGAGRCAREAGGGRDGSDLGERWETRGTCGGQTRRRRDARERHAGEDDTHEPHGGETSELVRKDAASRGHRGRHAGRETCAGCGGELVSPTRRVLQPGSQSCSVFLEVEPALRRPRQGGCSDLSVRDSGYEGTETDSQSFRPGSSSLELDSPDSSQSNCTGGEEEVIPRIAPLSPARSFPSQDSLRRNDHVRSAGEKEAPQHQDVLEDTADVDCDVTGGDGVTDDHDVTFPVEAGYVLQVTEQSEEGTESSEEEALLAVAECTADDELQLEEETFL